MRDALRCAALVRFLVAPPRAASRKKAYGQLTPAVRLRALTLSRCKLSRCAVARRRAHARARKADRLQQRFVFAYVVREQQDQLRVGRLALRLVEIAMHVDERF